MFIRWKLISFHLVLTAGKKTFYLLAWWNIWATWGVFSGCQKKLRIRSDKYSLCAGCSLRASCGLGHGWKLFHFTESSFAIFFPSLKWLNYTYLTAVAFTFHNNLAEGRKICVESLIDKTHEINSNHKTWIMKKSLKIKLLHLNCCFVWDALLLDKI